MTVIDETDTDGRAAAHTCSEWQERGLTVTTMADIDPDGEEGILEPVEILCDLDSEPGLAITVIGKIVQLYCPCTEMHSATMKTQHKHVCIKHYIQ